MQDTKYKEIDPGKKIIKTLITRFFLFNLGIAMQTAYRVDPDVKNDLDKFPETFTFLLAVVNGPSLLMMKKSGSFQYLGEKEVFHADVEVWFKNIEYAYLTMTGRISVPNTAYHNRQFVKGDLKYLIPMIRVMSIAQTLLLPNFISRFYIKEVPKLTFKKVINRGITYFNTCVGFIK